MPPEHELLAAHVLGRLTPEESATFAEHLAGCARCRAEEAELRAVGALLRRAGTTPAPSPALEERTLAAVRAAGEPPAALLAAAPSRPRRLRGRLPSPALAAAAAAGLALAFVLGAQTGGGVEVVPDTRLPGSQEKAATLQGDGFTAMAQVNVTGPGRVVSVMSETVPIIPKGTYYELWFVGPDDTPERPDRVSAGTWHPDSKGITDVRFLVAADPALFPRIEVTQEPPDGDPTPSGDVVLEG